MIICTNTTNNIYNMLIEIKGIWYYIYSVLSIIKWELFLVSKKIGKSTFILLRKPLISVFLVFILFTVSKWDFVVSCASQYSEDRYYCRFVFKIKAIWHIVKNMKKETSKLEKYHKRKLCKDISRKLILIQKKNNW